MIIRLRDPFNLLLLKAHPCTEIDILSPQSEALGKAKEASNEPPKKV